MFPSGSTATEGSSSLPLRLPLVRKLTGPLMPELVTAGGAELPPPQPVTASRRQITLDSLSFESCGNDILKILGWSEAEFNLQTRCYTLVILSGAPRQCLLNLRSQARSRATPRMITSPCCIKAFSQKASALTQVFRRI